MAKHEYHEGPKAREAFDKGMTKLFQVPKDAVKERPKRKKKSKGNSGSSSLLSPRRSD